MNLARKASKRRTNKDGYCPLSLYNSALNVEPNGLGIMAAGQRQTGLSGKLCSKAYAVLFLSQVQATIVANDR